MHPEKIELGSGLRHDTGKLMFNLINPLAQEGMVRVLTKGALKYEDHNWEKGMPWSKVLGPLKRHLNAIEKGEDYDFYPDTCEDCKKGSCINHTGELHVDHLLTNAHFLATFFRTYPQGDDRYEKIRPRPKIGLDIDDVLADFIPAWCNEFHLSTPTSWWFDKHILQRLEHMKNSGDLINFYLNLKPLTKPADIPFEPHCYVTSRPVDSAVTVKWLEDNGYPLRPVITVPVGTSKVEVLKASGVDIFVDDRYDNFEELNRNGICCFLFDSCHNQRYNVGYRRIKTLKELMNKT